MAEKTAAPNEANKQKAVEICAANKFPISYVERWVSERNQRLANSIAQALAAKEAEVIQAIQDCDKCDLCEDHHVTKGK